MIVHVAFADPARLADPRCMAIAIDALDPGERERCARLVRAEDRQGFAAMHYLVRRTLSRVTGMPVSGWRYRIEANGKPHVAPDVLTPAPAFNGAHTNGLVMCAVSHAVALGVDVERLRDDAPVEIAEQFFAPVERAFLDALEPAMRPHAFLTLWTRKEAYIKARGTGLSLSLDAFAVDPHGTRITADTSIDEAPERWCLTSLRPLPTHVASICHDGGERDFEILIDNFV